MLQSKNYTVSYTMPYKSELPKFVPIAPSTEKSIEMDCSVTRKYNYKNNYNGAQAASIARRNARERNRVKQVNDGFNALRKRLPVAVVNALSGGARRGSGKKLSKVDTLRMVVEYIRYLENLIEDSDSTLGVTETKVPMDISSPCDVDEGIFAGRNSPYSDSVPSPVNSECSSGVSSSYSNTNNEYYANNYYSENSPVDDNDLLDAITWWQQK